MRIIRLEKSKKRRSERPAFTMIEVLAAVFLLTACLTAFGQLRVMMTREERKTAITDIAQRQLRNVWERLDAVSESDLIAENFAKEPFETLAANTLPNGELKFEILPITFHGEKSGDVILHQARLTVSWDDGPGRPRRAAALSRILP